MHRMGIALTKTTARSKSAQFTGTASRIATAARLNTAPQLNTAALLGAAALVSTLSWFGVARAQQPATGASSTAPVLPPPSFPQDETQSPHPPQANEAPTSSDAAAAEPPPAPGAAEPSASGATPPPPAAPATDPASTAQPGVDQTAPSADSEAALPEAQACVPACRAGYRCSEGSCLSACNPPCAEGYECTAELSCERLMSPEAIEALKEQATQAKLDEEKAEREARIAHRHDGFYLRIGLSLGSINATLDTGVDEFDFSGGGRFLDLNVGGTVAPGFVLAFGMSGVVSQSPNSEAPSIDDRFLSEMAAVTMGLLVDWFPSERGGFHVSALLGIGVLDISPGEPTEGGFGMIGGVGYDLWASAQWSLGVAGRVQYITGVQGDSGDYDAVVPMLSFTALYH